VNLVLHLKIVGVLLVLLALLHLTFPRRFKWREELQTLSLLNRQIFLVHTFFVALAVLLGGLLTFFCAEALLERTLLARAVLSALALFWLARWVVQLFVYSPRLWRGHRFNTAAHALFTCLWAYFVAVYGSALFSALR
jgi:hypothetical protein